MFVLPATLTLDGGGGKLGTLTKMDTETPVLYVEFPQVCGLHPAATMTASCPVLTLSVVIPRTPR